MFSCVYALVTGKYAEVLKRLLSEIRDASAEAGFELRSLFIICDLKEAAFKAYKSIWLLQTHKIHFRERVSIVDYMVLFEPGKTIEDNMRLYIDATLVTEIVEEEVSDAEPDERKDIATNADIQFHIPTQSQIVNGQTTV